MAIDTQYCDWCFFWARNNKPVGNAPCQAERDGSSDFYD